MSRLVIESENGPSPVRSGRASLVVRVALIGPTLVLSRLALLRTSRIIKCLFGGESKRVIEDGGVAWNSAAKKDSTMKINL